MRSRSTRFDATVSGSHQLAVSVDIYFNRVPIRTGVTVVAGSVTLDRTAAQLGRCQMTLAEPFLISATGPLTPYGYEVAPKRGVTYADGTTELMPLGVFPIQQAAVDGVALTTAVTAVDRSQLVADARFEDDYHISAATNYATAIQTMVAAGVPGLTYSFASVPYTTPDLVFAAQGDRWEAARGMATAIGCELYFGGAGELVLRLEPSFTGTPAWSLVEGAGGLLVGAALALDRAPAYNRVVATGENTGNPTVYRGVWTDTDPGSPTFYDGGFGHKPRFYASPFITSDAQAASAATAIGVAQIGVARSLSFEGVPNPALEPGDALLVRRAALALNEIHLIDALTIDLSAARSMTGESRSAGTSFAVTPVPDPGGVTTDALIDETGFHLVSETGDRVIG